MESQWMKAQSNLNIMEDRMVKMFKEHEEEIQKWKYKYFQLMEMYDSVSAQVTDLQRLRDEDVREVGDGGVYTMKKKLTEMNETLSNFERQLNTQGYQVQQSMSVVGRTVLVKTQDLAQTKIRARLGINMSKQQPGDLAFGYIVSEHPWIPMLMLRNLSGIEEKEYPITKYEIVDQYLSASWQHFGQKPDEIEVILQPSPEQSMQSIWLNQLCAYIFNLQGKEGLDFFQMEQLRAIYNTVINVLWKQQEEQQKQQQLPYYLQQQQVAPTAQQLFHTRLSKQQIILILSECEGEFEEQELAVVKVLLMGCEKIVGRKNKFVEQQTGRVLEKVSGFSNDDDYLSEWVCEMMMDELWGEYGARMMIDRRRLHEYMLMRYYVYFNKHIKYNSKESMSMGQDMMNSFLMDLIRRVQTLLLFNPHTFASSCNNNSTSIVQNEILQYPQISTPSSVIKKQQAQSTTMIKKLSRKQTIKSIK